MAKERSNEYNAFLQKSLSLKKVREERSKEVSKDVLFQSSKKKIQTTMIEAEFAQYDITKKRYSYNLPVIKPDNSLEGEDK